MSHIFPCLFPLSLRKSNLCYQDKHNQTSGAWFLHELWSHLLVLLHYYPASLSEKLRNFEMRSVQGEVFVKISVFNNSAQEECNFVEGLLLVCNICSESQIEWQGTYAFLESSLLNTWEMTHCSIPLGFTAQKATQFQFAILTHILIDFMNSYLRKKKKRHSKSMFGRIKVLF